MTSTEQTSLYLFLTFFFFNHFGLFFFTSLKSKHQQQQGKDVPTKFPVKETPLKPQFVPPNTPNSRFIVIIGVLFFFSVSHTSEVSLARGLQSCPAAQGNSQVYLQFPASLLIWAEREGGLGEA